MGFKLTCENCQKEIRIQSGELCASELNDGITVYPIQGRVLIKCDCSNESDIDEC